MNAPELINYIAHFRKQYQSAVEHEATLGLAEMPYIQLAITAEVLVGQKQIMKALEKMEQDAKQRVPAPTMPMQQPPHSTVTPQVAPLSPEMKELSQRLKRMEELLTAKSKS